MFFVSKSLFFSALYPTNFNEATTLLRHNEGRIHKTKGDWNRPLSSDDFTDRESFTPVFLTRSATSYTGHTPKRDNTTQAIALTLIGCGLLTVNDALMKVGLRDIVTQQISQSALAIVACTNVMAVVTGKPLAPICWQPVSP